MILSDVEILDRVNEGDLGLSPLGDIEQQVQPASVDLRLSTEFYRFEPDRTVKIKPDGDNPTEIGDYTTYAGSEKLELEPGDFVLSSTRESIEMPDDICGLLFGRSGFGRLGVVPHIGAGFVNPGWRGRLTLELTNHGPHTVVLTPGETRIVQIAFLRLTTSAQTAYGEQPSAAYQDQEGVVQSKLLEMHPETE